MLHVYAIPQICLPITVPSMPRSAVTPRSLRCQSSSMSMVSVGRKSCGLRSPSVPTTLFPVKVTQVSIWGFQRKNKITNTTQSRKRKEETIETKKRNVYQTQRPSGENTRTIGGWLKMGLKRRIVVGLKKETNWVEEWFVERMKIEVVGSVEDWFV